MSGVTGPMFALARQASAGLSREANVRLRWLDWHRQYGQNVSLTCRHFGTSRETFDRWQRRYNPPDLRRLADRPSRPNRRREPTWTPEQAASPELQALWEELDPNVRRQSELAAEDFVVQYETRRR